MLRLPSASRPPCLMLSLAKALTLDWISCPLPSLSRPFPCMMKPPLCVTRKAVVRSPSLLYKERRKEMILMFHATSTFAIQESMILRCWRCPGHL